jgi:hypothetical protein
MPVTVGPDYLRSHDLNAGDVTNFAYIGLSAKTSRVNLTSKRHLFFAIVAKSGRDVFYHPQVCNLTSPLHSNRVATPDGASMWLEDLVVKQHGPGEPPRDDPGSTRLP